MWCHIVSGCPPFRVLDKPHCEDCSFSNRRPGRVELIPESYSAIRVHRRSSQAGAFFDFHEGGIARAIYEDRQTGTLYAIPEQMSSFFGVRDPQSQPPLAEETEESTVSFPLGDSR